MNTNTSRLSRNERNLRLTDVNVVPQCRLSGLPCHQCKGLTARHLEVIETRSVVLPAQLQPRLCVSGRQLVQEDGSELGVGEVCWSFSWAIAKHCVLLRYCPWRDRKNGGCGYVVVNVGTECVCVCVCVCACVCVCVCVCERERERERERLTTYAY